MEPKLDNDELRSLEEVAKGGLLKRSIPEEHKSKLMQLGFIEQGLGGLSATTQGRMFLSRQR